MSNAKLNPLHTSSLKPVTLQDTKAILAFLNRNNLLYQHLDWLSPSDWVGHQPFILDILNEEIQAVLLTAPEVFPTSWVRLFGIKKTLNIAEVWDRLFFQSRKILKEMGINQLAALGIANWLKPKLIKTGFQHAGEIVFLEHEQRSVFNFPQPTEVFIRPMSQADLPAVFEVDQDAFQPLWQNSLKSLTKAYSERGIKTVAIFQNRVIGYQISTLFGTQAHLARLAVHSNYQKKNIASALLYSLFDQLHTQGVWRVTVNTQANNHASLALYHKFGFQISKRTISFFLINI